MRQIDQPEPFQPLGPPIRRDPSPPPAPEWKPTGTPGTERGPDGRLRNVSQPPEVTAAAVAVGAQQLSTPQAAT